MLGKEVLKQEVALAFPYLGMQQLFLFLDFGFPPAYWLVRATHAPLPSFAHWKGLIEVTYGVPRVASSRR